MSTAFPQTFLELCQRTASECGVSTTGPSAISNQVGRLKQIVDWVNSAWIDIQTRHNEWLFMVGSFSVNTTSGDGSYSPADCGITHFRDWRRDTFYVYLTAAGAHTQTPLDFLEYLAWYQIYNVNVQVNSYPVNFTIGNDKSIILAPKPNDIYTVTGEYQKSASEMIADSDEPGIPAEYRMAIVYGAMVKYGRFAGAPEVYSDGVNGFSRLMNQMERTQLPEMEFGEPL